MSDDFGSKEWFEQFQKMWNPMNFPFPGMVQPTLDPDEIEKKIAELKAVESWLKMNVGMVEMAINTMEMQKATLETLRESAQHAGAASRRTEDDKKGG
ncbi:MAG: hypothetical protein JSW48_04920 [Betaproteobacteria bacterium]|jgi:hypothetical protein|nr:MAG: hypothetical protein JSW48_04920 [Betaproteobacteria bacterium]